MTQETVESKAEWTNSGVPGLYPAKNRYSALWTNGRARGVGFYLILECTRFCPQTDQVHKFMAAALNIILC